ncbi:MAG: hypothetical protein M1816_005770 [Peltula sp. TS41687]|nr:MAG: hypothetical protein M1816_005770 [Peltula sp. TS41687]
MESDLRHKEYPALGGPSDDLGVTYLDHAGTTLYAASLPQEFTRVLNSNLFGNPHSASPSSKLSSDRVEQVRSRVLKFCGADAEHFDVVFVQNATAAIKLVGEAFSGVGSPGFWYGYHIDAHTSLVGLRYLATESKCFESDQEVEGWLEARRMNDIRPSRVGLFAYPAQSNMNGRRLPMNWPARSRRRQAKHQNLYILLDAAAYAMTGVLDLSDVASAPEFTALSFYKIFGFPDLGALIVRKTAGEIMQRRRFFGGGTVGMVTVLDCAWVAKKVTTIHEQLEDGTLPFHMIIALDIALDVHEKLYGFMASVSRHTCSLAADLYKRLASLRHANGRPVCEIYKDMKSAYGDVKTQGPTIAFNLRNAQGGWIAKSDVERLAIVRNFHLRTGGVCNSGGVATWCGLSYWEMRQHYFEGMRCGDDIDLLGGKPTGIVRVSLGAMSSEDDVTRFINFVQDLFPCLFAADEAEADCFVKSLLIYPIAGCASWSVPENVAWPIRQTGLEWDAEWCIVSLGDNSLLNRQTHPRMMTIKPDLEIEKGIIRLVANGEQLDVSLWESPPSAEDSISGSTHRKADPYPSEAYSNFFTAVLGVPSTLGKVRRTSRDESTLTVALLAGAIGCANITPSSPLTSGHQQRFMRISTQYFMVSPDPVALAGIKLVHLPNPYDRSPTAQNPTVQVNNHIQMISEESNDHPTLRACIACLDMREHICPVWNCRQDFDCAVQLTAHLEVHKARVVKR